MLLFSIRLLMLVDVEDPLNVNSLCMHLCVDLNSEWY